MQLTLIFDSQYDRANQSIEDLINGVLSNRKRASNSIAVALEKSLKLDLEDGIVDLYENGNFVLVREESRDRLFTKE